jgi:hypothetical protein
MAPELDEAWIEEAIARHRRVDVLRADFDRAAAAMQVSVRSPDESVEVVVTAAGAVVDVRLHGPLNRRTNGELGRAIRDAVVSAADAARWAREKLHDEVFTEFRPLGGPR